MDAFPGLAHSLQRVFGTHDSGIALVGGIDDENGVIIGDVLELLQGDDAVTVNGVQSAVGARQSDQALDSEEAGKQEHSGETEADLLSDGQVLHTFIKGDGVIVGCLSAIRALG
jgi:hypothetical protein